MSEPRRVSAGEQCPEASANLKSKQASRRLIGAHSATPARRQLPAWQYIAAEPRRLAHADIERMCAELPYGYWRDANNRVVIFNRRYRPLWQRLPDGRIERADAGEWIKFVEQRWFNYTDARYEKGTRERLREILRKFFAGEDLAAHTIITEWDFDQRAAKRGVQP